MNTDNLCLPFSKIKSYIKLLSKHYEVYFPIKKGTEFKFTNNINLVDNFNQGITQIPPKEFFLPPNEEIIRYDNSNNPKIPKVENNKKILFAVHPFDVKAITILDDILTKQNPDFYYVRNRINYYIISLGEFSFVDNFKCDIHLENNGDTYEVYLKNPQSSHLLDYKNIFSHSKFEFENKKYIEDPLFKNPQKLADAIEYSYNNDIWDELAKIDLCCGICTYTCPLCYCFKLKDNFCFSSTCNAKRTKKWDSCFSPDFFNTAGHNYRKNRRDRIYNWYHHKFVRMYRETGYMGCVDCGRCTKYCPAGINFKHVLKTILNDYEKYLQE